MLVFSVVSSNTYSNTAPRMAANLTLFPLLSPQMKDEEAKRQQKDIMDNIRKRRNAEDEEQQSARDQRGRGRGRDGDRDRHAVRRHSGCVLALTIV